MEEILNLNLNTNENEYIDDLNYEWCGGNAFVVICGDIIDPGRKDSMCVYENGSICNYYPQIELKILMFINAINKQAMKNKGRIYKLLGNHEMMNISNINKQNQKKYIDKYDIDIDKKYYKDIPRSEIFMHNNHGFKLLFEDKCGILIKINNIIYVHGSLLDSYKNYHDINNNINDPKINQEKIDSIFTPGTTPVKTLQGRKFGNGYEYQQNKNICNTLSTRFNNFLKDEENLILVIGHCPQYLNLSSINYDIQNDNYNYTNITNDLVSDTFMYNTDNAIDQKSANTDAYGKNIYGITMGCKTCENNICNHRLYRIDVGSSRSFDLNINGYDNIINIETENKYLYSRTPQILKIGKDKKISIIKSKMKNTRIHQPRKIYEEYISNLIEKQNNKNITNDLNTLLININNNFIETNKNNFIKIFVKYANNLTIDKLYNIFFNKKLIIGIKKLVLNNNENIEKIDDILTKINKELSNNLFNNEFDNEKLKFHITNIINEKLLNNVIKNEAYKLDINNPTNEHYKQKYLKYKNKYLHLKQL